LELSAHTIENIQPVVKSKARFITRLANRQVRLSLFILLFVWCTGFLLPVLFPKSGLIEIILPFIRHAYSNVCHQVDKKCFYINGKELLVCARCTGIYLGAFITLFVLLISNKKFFMNLKILLMASIPMFVDVLLNTVNIKSYSKVAAFLTGALFGSVVLIYILTIIENQLLTEIELNENK
jgi:uncharacterized membrane protein